MSLGRWRLGFLHTFTTSIDYLFRRLGHKREVDVFLCPTNGRVDSEVCAADVGDLHYVEAEGLGHQYDCSLRRRSGVGGKDSPKEQDIVFVDEHVGEERKIRGQGV